MDVKFINTNLMVLIEKLMKQITVLTTKIFYVSRRAQKYQNKNQLINDEIDSSPDWPLQSYAYDEVFFM